MGSMVDRTHKELTTDDIAKIARTYHAWRNESPLLEGEDLGEGKKTPGSLVQWARELRRNQTDAEKLMWQALKNRQMPRRNSADSILSNPISSIFIAMDIRHQLAIEVDGSQHYKDEGRAKDEVRTEALNEKGIRVLRFDNRQVLTETEAVLTQEYQDIAGFCKAAMLEEIKANDFVLTPGRYVGAAEIEDDGIPFEEKMADLTQTLYRQMEESGKLDAAIRKNLEGLGYGE